MKHFGDENARRAWIGVGAPIVALVLVIIALAIAAYGAFAREQDRTFEQTTQRLAASAMEGRAESMRVSVVDFANWDAAHDAISVRWNAAWVRGNIYSSVADAMFVLRTDGTVRYAWFGEAGQPAATEVQAVAVRTGLAIPGLRRLARAATPEETAAHTFARLGDRLVLVSIAPVTREEQAVRLAPQRANNYDYIAAVELLDAEDLAAIGAAIGLQDFIFTRAADVHSPDSVRLPLTTADGGDIGALEWRNLRPGSAAFAEKIGWVVFALMLIGAVTVMMARRLVTHQIKTITKAKAALDLGREKSEFLARVSTELRTPLEAVVNYAELIQEGATSTQNRDDAQQIIDAARRLGLMLNDIIDQSHINADTLRLHPEVLPVGGLLAEALGAIQPVARMNGVEVIVTQEAAAVYVFADHGRMRQCLLNLVGNAVKFSHRGGSVRVHAHMAPEAKHDVVVFAVSDGGVGIEPQALPNIFRPFGQAHAAIAAVYGGAGLGLSIARSLARSMGGDITVASTPGEGATFYLRVPAAHARARNAA